MLLEVYKEDRIFFAALAPERRNMPIVPLNATPKLLEMLALRRPCRTEGRWRAGRENSDSYGVCDVTGPN